VRVRRLYIITYRRRPFRNDLRRFRALLIAPIVLLYYTYYYYYYAAAVEFYFIKCEIVLSYMEVRCRQVVGRSDYSTVDVKTRWVGLRLIVTSNNDNVKYLLAKFTRLHYTIRTYRYDMLETRGVFFA